MKSILPKHKPSEVDAILLAKWEIALFKFAQIFAISPTDIYVQKAHKPFTSEELRELQNSLIRLWEELLKRARHIDHLLNKAGGLLPKVTPDSELLQDMGIDAFYRQYVLPRELLIFYFEKTCQLGKRGVGLGKKSIVAVGWGNLISNRGRRIDWKLLGDLYFWFWEKILAYRSYSEWMPTEGIEDYLKVQYHRNRLTGGLENYLISNENIFSSEDEKQNLQFLRNLILYKWAEGKIPDNLIPRLLLNIVTDWMLGANEGLTLFSPTGAFVDPSFGYLRLWAKQKKGIELSPVPDELACIAEKAYGPGMKLPGEGTELGEYFLYALSLYLDKRADKRHLPPMIIFPDRSYFSPGL